jgi:hypothetical protein
MISFLAIISSCTSIQYTARKEPRIFIQNEDSIVFITMKIWYDSLKNKNNIEVVSVSKIPGRLKQLLENELHGNYLSCVIYNTQNKASESFTIQHPLLRDVEFIDENNRLAKKFIRLKESEFFIRFEKRNYNFLKISENTLLYGHVELLNVDL